MDKAFSQHTIDTGTGTAAVAAGSVSGYFQMVTDVTSVLLSIANLALVLGGCYLLFFRIKKARREAKENENKKDAN